MTDFDLNVLAMHGVEPSPDTGGYQLHHALRNGWLSPGYMVPGSVIRRYTQESSRARTTATAFKKAETKAKCPTCGSRIDDFWAVNPSTVHYYRCSNRGVCGRMFTAQRMRGLFREASKPRPVDIVEAPHFRGSGILGLAAYNPPVPPPPIGESTVLMLKRHSLLTGHDHLVLRGMHEELQQEAARQGLRIVSTHASFEGSDIILRAITEPLRQARTTTTPGVAPNDYIPINVTFDP